MNDSEQILHSEWLRDKLREGSEARHIINRLTPDGKEEVEAVPLEWAVETFQASLQHYISKEEVERAIPSKKELKFFDTKAFDERFVGYNSAIEEIRKNLGLDGGK